LPAWAAERLADVTLTWAIVSMGGIELNPLPAAFMAHLGVGKGLAAFFVFTLLIGAALPVIIDRLLSCGRCMTSLDRVLLVAVGGKEAYARAVLYAALIVGFMPIVINGWTFLVLVQLVNSP
jgi:hypothetical protein